jgi:hypothetical protein
MVHRGIEYIQLTKDYHPTEGQILYKIDVDYGEKLPPLEGKVTRWGANNHDDFLVNVDLIYPQEILDKWVKKYGKKILKDNKKRDFWWIPNCYIKK